MITQRELKETLHYDPATGIFTWLVDTGDRPRKGKRAGGPTCGSKRAVPYWNITVYGKRYVASHLACLYMTGTSPKEEMDHRDRNSLNDAWDNLREATRYENEINKGAYRNNRCGLKGVQATRYGTYKVAIQRHWRRVYLGTFETAGEAAAVYEAAARAT